MLTGAGRTMTKGITLSIIGGANMNTNNKRTKLAMTHMQGFNQVHPRKDTQARRYQTAQPSVGLVGKATSPMIAILSNQQEAPMAGERRDSVSYAQNQGGPTTGQLIRAVIAQHW